MRRPALIALVLVAGCGGAEEKTPPTAAQWHARASAACERATDSIVARGWAHDVADMRTLVPKGVADVRAAIAAIRRMPVPAGDTDARWFVDDLHALEPRLDDLEAASKAQDLRAITEATTRLDPKLRAVASSAQRAALHECLWPADPLAVVDGLRAPVAAEQFARLEEQFLRDLPPGRRGEALATIRGTIAAVSDHVTALDDIQPPYWAEDAMGDYRAAMSDFRDSLEHLLDRAEAGRWPPPAAIDRTMRRHGKRIDDRERRLWARLDAAPVTDPTS